MSITESTHMHEETIRHNPFYSTFPVSTDSIEVQDLIRSSSNYYSAPTPAFADCFTARKRSMPTRLVKMVERYNNGKGASSLMNVWRSGKEGRRESLDVDIEPPTPSPNPDEVPAFFKEDVPLLRLKLIFRGRSTGYVHEYLTCLKGVTFGRTAMNYDFDERLTKNRMHKFRDIRQFDGFNFFRKLLLSPGVLLQLMRSPQSYAV
ncbi:NAD(P)H-dependent D-xylose reductase (XR) [Ascosphaera pollenicola]|nr:NAD(P)H-dependent D-xylose reductase (XR) [Ascosphaera pollenicola]